MMGFKDAGGVVLHDFWEYAPAGRPHLYPPLFHVILLLLYKPGLPTLFIIRFVSVAIYPLLLLTILWVVTKLYNDRIAFFTVLAASLPYVFFLNAITAIPASISLIILIFLFYAIETKNIFCGILLLGLSFYSHGGIPWLTILAITIYSVFRRENFKIIISIIIGGIVLGGPWLISMIRNKGYFLSANTCINNYFEGNILLYIFAAVGVLVALKQKGRSLFYLALFIGMAPMIKDYLFRFLCGEGLLPVIFLAGLGLEKSYSKVSDFLKGKMNPAIYSMLLPWVVFYLVTFYSPAISIDTGHISFSIHGSTLLKYEKFESRKESAMESTIYLNYHMERLFDIIKANTRPDEIIYCNYGYVAGIFYAFTDRATSDGMLNEVKPIYYSDPAISASLIIWIKNPEGVFEPELKALIDRLGLVKITETEIAYVYKNPVVISHKIVSKPVVPSNIAFLILLAWIGAIFICIIRHY